MNKEYIMENTAKTTEIKIKPLSTNGFVAFFQKIARWWLGGWYAFSDKHPKLASLIYKVFFFIVFSEGVTIWQFLVMLFLPNLFVGLEKVPFIWPQVMLGINDPETGLELFWAIFNEPMIDAAGHILPSTEAAKSLAVIGGGLGNFIAFEIAVFTAQCINFPLQRNITFRSKGNPWYQAMWYFIGWVLISIFVNALVGIVTPFLTSWGWNKVIRDLIKTFITGGISMIIFFFIFMVIFPDYNKMLKSKTAKVEKLKASGASAEDIAAAEADAAETKKHADLFNADKERVAADNIANAKAIAWDYRVKKYDKMKAKGATQEELDAEQKIIDEKYEQAYAAAVKRDEANALYQSLNA